MRNGILVAAVAVLVAHSEARSQMPAVANPPMIPQASLPDTRPIFVTPPLVVPPVHWDEPAATEPPRSVAVPSRMQPRYVVPERPALAPTPSRGPKATAEPALLTSPLVGSNLPAPDAKAPATEPAQAPQCSTCLAPEPCAPRFWAGAEYLLWWLSSPNSPPLVTTGNPGDAPPGALDQPGTRILFGNGPIDYGAFSGIRVNFGFRFGGCWSVESSAFLLERWTASFSAASDAAGNPPLFVPVESAINGESGSYTIADPVHGFAGNIAVASSTRLWGADFNIGHRLCGCRPVAVDLLCGFRYFDLHESLIIDGFNNDFLFDIQRTSNDRFATRNQFYGGQFGGRVGYQRGRFFAGVLGLVALGATHQVVEITGSSTLAGSGAIAGTNPGGILTQPSNIGRQTHDQFTVVPQAQVKIGWDVTQGLRATLGYDFLYWNRVVRPGNQIDRTVDITQVDGGPPALRPAPQFNQTDFFAHGVNVGLEYRY